MYSRSNTAEVGYRENGIKDSLKPGVFAFLREHVHLEEALVGVFLDLDQIRDLDRGPESWRN
jgi:hypothetical protein